MRITTFDRTLINWFKKYNEPLARFALFVVFFWFGALKVVGQSPAGPLVENLLHKTLPFMSFTAFNLLFGFFEMLIGILFLIPHAERVALPLLLLHMATTILPLFLLPSLTWHTFLAPTLEGQYIIKNLVILALACGIAAHLHPLHNHSKQ